MTDNKRYAVVGHVEWVDFAKVDAVPKAGQIVHAQETWGAPAGGGGVSAFQLAQLAGNALLFTALGKDALGAASLRGLQALGISVFADWREEPQRRAFTYIDANGERTITVLGERLEPRGANPLPWDELEGAATYFTAGDSEALRQARAKSRVLVAPSRILPFLRDAGQPLDVLVGSGEDAREQFVPSEVGLECKLFVITEGALGGWYQTADGETGRYNAAVLSRAEGDSYGCGDCFAAGLTFGLGEGLPLERVLHDAAICGAACRMRKGPYGELS